MIGWHTFKPSCINIACIATEKKPIHSVSATEASGLLCPEQPSLCGDIHVLHVRILTLQLAYHGALAVDFMPYAGKWSKQVFNTQCVCYSTRSVCLSVCLSTSY